MTRRYKNWDHPKWHVHTAKLGKVTGMVYDEHMKNLQNDTYSIEGSNNFFLNKKKLQCFCKTTSKFWMSIRNCWLKRKLLKIFEIKSCKQFGLADQYCRSNSRWFLDDIKFHIFFFLRLLDILKLLRFLFFFFFFWVPIRVSF